MSDGNAVRPGERRVSRPPSAFVRPKGGTRMRKHTCQLLWGLCAGCGLPLLALLTITAGCGRPAPQHTGETKGQVQAAPQHTNETKGQTAAAPTGEPAPSNKEPPPKEAAAEPAVLTARATLKGGGFDVAPDGRTLAYLGDNAVRLANLATGKERVVVPGAAPHVLFSPDGKSLAWVTRPKEGGSTVHVWDLVGNNERKSLPIPRADWDRVVSALSFSPDSKRVAATGGGKNNWSFETRLWEIAAGKEAGHFVVVEPRSEPPDRLLFTPDGKALICGGRRMFIVASWDLSAGKERAPLKDPFLLGRSGDGKTLATTDVPRKTVYLWDAATGATRGKVPAYGVYRATFSPDGPALAVAGFGSNYIVLLDTAAAKPKRNIDPRSNVTTEPAFSPDGRILAWGAGPFPEGASRGRVFLADTRSGQVRAVLEGHTDLVGTIAFAEQGRTLVSASNDGTIKLWDVAKAKPEPSNK